MTETDTLERPLTKVLPGAIDCDIHPRSPKLDDLMPHLDAYWRDMLPERDIDRLELTTMPTSIGSWALPGGTDGVQDAASLGKSLLDPTGVSAGILNLVNGVQALYDPYMSTAICQATNRWLASDWLDRDPRLRAGLVIPFRNPEAAAEEINRYRDDKRFVQIIALAMGEAPLGRRDFWPIYRAAAEAGFALNIQPGSIYRASPTQSGYLSSLVEEQVHQTQGFASQIASLLAEGVFTEFPEMKTVLAGSGAGWLFGLSWRMAKDWRGARVEVPWIKDSPDDIIARQVRMTIRPLDAPPDPADGAELIDCIGSPDMLLYSSDYPRAHPDAPGTWPAEIPAEYAAQICKANALATYPRLEVTP
ncbi:amidohydrolase family protein [Pseudoruegeria sp. HB172150]|uniref:amidohydrolase family protein n=1 Tax=Pseudoruegeria sp. HB172150 TaxID=2721164 RepID=UPI001556D109|nr:amidohydrolase family protein [Pseudoruegeria sp. HB172150]